MKNFIKLFILILITKEIIPLNEEYLLILSFTIFLYLFYKSLVNFFYSSYSGQTDYTDYAFNILFASEKKSIKLLARAFSKFSMLNPKLISSNRRSHGNKVIVLCSLDLSQLHEKSSSLNWAVFELVSWFFTEETLFYQQRLLKNIETFLAI